MQKPFEPSPDAMIAKIELEPLECQAQQLDVIDMVTRMVRIDSVHLDFATNLLSVSFYPPCTEEAIRSRLDAASYFCKPVAKQELKLEKQEFEEAIPA